MSLMRGMAAGSSTVLAVKYDSHLTRIAAAMPLLHFSSGAVVAATKSAPLSDISTARNLVLLDCPLPSWSLAECF